MTWRFPRSLPESVRTRRVRAQLGGPGPNEVITRSRAPPTKRKRLKNNTTATESSSPAPERTSADESGMSGSSSVANSGTKPTVSTEAEHGAPSSSPSQYHDDHNLHPGVTNGDGDGGVTNVGDSNPNRAGAGRAIHGGGSRQGTAAMVSASTHVKIDGGEEGEKETYHDDHHDRVETPAPKKRIRELLESCPERVAREMGRRCLEVARNLVGGGTSTAVHQSKVGPSPHQATLDAADVLPDAELKTFFLFASTAGGRCRRDCPDFFSHLTKRVAELRTLRPASTEPSAKPDE